MSKDAVVVARRANRSPVVEGGKRRECDDCGHGVLIPRQSNPRVVYCILCGLDRDEDSQ